MNDAMRILVAVDDSAATERALAYTGQMLRNVPDARVFLLHVLGPLPADVAGPKPPSAEQRDRQAAWMVQAREAARPLLERAKERLVDTGVAEAAIEPHTVDAPSGELADAILQAARDARCETVVVGRDAISWAPQLFRRHVGEHVVQDGRGVAVWVVG